MSGKRADLRVYWSKRERALVYDGSKPTGGMLAGIIEGLTIGEMNGRECGTECNRNGILARVRKDHPPDPTDKRTLAQELDARGYDLSTLRFSIRKKTP
jgi:hypothetical protein